MKKIKSIVFTLEGGHYFEVGKVPFGSEISITEIKYYCDDSEYYGYEIHNSNGLLVDLVCPRNIAVTYFQN